MLQERTYRNVLDMHLSVPQPGKFIVNLPSLLILDSSTNRIPCAREVSFRLEFYVRDQVVLLAPNETVISELIFHLSEKDSTRVHVWLSQRAIPKLESIWSRAKSEQWYTYYVSPFFLSVPLFSRRRKAIPSIILAAEFPKNLLLGFKVPSIRMWCSGAIKK